MTKYIDKKILKFKPSLMITKIFSGEKNVFLFGCMIGVMFFLGIYGYSRILPWNDEWLMSGSDLTQHYLGWCAYRESPWSFPLCLTDKLSYPITTSVMFTDSIPLWAVFFKLLSPLLPETFQYIGLFGLVTFALQGGFAALWLRKLKCSVPVAFVGSAIICFMTPLMQRMFTHTALSSHWIIFAALCIWFTDEKSFKHKYSCIALWCALAFVSVSIHIYVSAMFCVVLLGYCLFLALTRTAKKVVFARFFLPIASIVLSTFVFGGFVGSNYPGGGYPDFFTSNLTALFDSDGWSKFGWPDLASATAGQYEGFAYLGLGVIILVFISLFSLAVRLELKRATEKTSDGTPAKLCFRDLISTHPKGFSLAIVVMISLLLGLGSTVTCLDKTLFSYPFPDLILMIWSVFRSTGRFTWIAMYIITAVTITFIERNYKTAGKYLIIFALVIQLIDLYPFSRIPHETEEYKDPLSSHVWEEFSGYSHIYIDGNVSNQVQYAISKYALENDATVNKFYFARPPKDMPYPLEISNDTLYIFAAECEASDMFSVYTIDGLIVAASADTQGNFYEVMSRTS